MIDATTQRPSAPTIDDIESKRCMHLDRRMQGRRQVPRLVAHASHEFARPAGRAERYATSGASDDVAAFVQSLHPDLQTLDGGIDDPHRVAGHPFFAQHIPGLERLSQFELHAAALHGAIMREAKLSLRVEPCLL